MLAALAELGPATDAPIVTDAILKRQLADWGDPPGDAPLAHGVLLLALVSWARMHGIVSLEIEGVFEQLGLDPAPLQDRDRPPRRRTRGRQGSRLS